MKVTLQSQVTAVPKVEVKPIVSVCETAGMLAIECEILSGAPDRFDLTFPDSAHKAGLKDSINGIFPAEGVIEIPLPADIPLGSQSLTIVFYADQASSADCKTSNPQTLTFSVDMDGFVHRKDNDVLFVDNSGKHDEKGLTFVSYQCYKNGEPIKGATNQYYYEYNGLNGYYQVIMTGTDGVEYRSCVYDMRPMEGIEELNAAEGGIRKVIRNGQLLLIVGDRVYNVTGQEVVR
jgi:hypothetical protein